MLAYIQKKFTEKKEDTTAAGGATGEPTKKKGNNWILIALLGSLAVLGFILHRSIGFLDNASRQKEGGEAIRQPSVWDVLFSKRAVGLYSFILICAAGWLTIMNAISLGRQQGYAPEQPIKFSHTLHAGKQQIPCQYCHDLARRSKHSGIPGVSTCVNCHAVVKQGEHPSPAAKGASSAEILKIYMAAGFNPNNSMYIPNYNPADNVQMDTIFRRWLTGVYKDAGVSPGQSKEMVETGFQAALKLAGKPIEWVRIHNLPDHVYFNHSQHVVAGGIQCQTCHGPVEKMDLVYQYSPLSMGWCINCHRKTDVKFAENSYYDAYYEKYHKELESGKREKVTVEDIGGLECQKCHY